MSGNPSQYDDLSLFVEEQERMREAVAASRLPWLEVDVGDDDVAGAADRVADWLAATGGLEMPDAEEVRR